MQKINKNISVEILKQMSEKMFNQLVKAVVDIEKEVMVVDADLHADQEEYLLEEGSEQKNLWGINLYPYNFLEEDWIEFDSMTNVRPSMNNKTRGIENEEVRKKVIKIVNKLVTK